MTPMREESERGGNIYFFLGVVVEEFDDIPSDSASFALGDTYSNSVSDYRVNDAAARVQLFHSEELNSSL